jgi:hypothetical protein
MVLLAKNTTAIPGVNSCHERERRLPGVWIQTIQEIWPDS